VQSDQRCILDSGPPPPHLSTFKWRGGGGPESQTQLSDGHDRGAQINGSWMASSLSATLPLTCVGPFPIMSSSFPPFSCCRMSSIRLPALARVVLPLSRHPLVACHVSRSFPRQPLTKEQVHYPSSSSPSAMCPPLSPFSHLATSFTPSIVLHYHSCHAPHPPRWPPRPFVKLFSYSRWQHEESSISQNAELARSSSIPRSSY
jgi:hypothetical protein